MISWLLYQIVPERDGKLIVQNYTAQEWEIEKIAQEIAISVQNFKNLVVKTLAASFTVLIAEVF